MALLPYFVIKAREDVANVTSMYDNGKIQRKGLMSFDLTK